MTPSVPSLRELFDVASELHGAARDDYLAQHCADPRQRVQVERLLAADVDTVDGVLGQDAAAALQALGDREAPVPALGQRIGAWELVALLGEGGSSTVFCAVRDHAGVRQEAALKLLRRGVYTVEAQRQFRRERQALATLSHPDIASLVEGGVTEHGLAYIALELVRGAPITDHVRERALGFSERLRLFLRVCRAVEAAHRALIVHRDLKPSNVLVSADGHVKLLDFGIAKLLDADDETQTRLPSFTPAYAAPEQRRGGAVTTSTDVYALGILLGELVTGRRLGDGSARAPSGQVAEDAGPGVLPAGPHTTRRLLRGDLDNIVLKAVADEPERRYASAGALADDIERLLDGRPVAAHPPSRWYRAKKFVARHRGGVATSVAFLLAVFVALGVALWQATVARRELQRADALRDFMVAAFEEAQPGVPREGPPRITEVVEQAIAKARADTRMNPRVRAELLTKLGSVLRIQGRFEPAREVLHSTFDEAWRELGDTSPLTLAAGGELVYLRLLAGDFTGARTLVDRLVPRSHGSPPLRSRLLAYSAGIATKERDRARGTADIEAAVALARAGGDERLLVRILSDQSNVQLAFGDVAGAAASLEEQLVMRERMHGPQHIDVAAVRAALSRAYRRLGDLDKAERHIRAALAIDDAVLSKDDWRRARHLNALLILLRAQRDFAAALDAATESLRINRIAYADDHPEIATDLENIGKLQLLLERPVDAREPLRDALARNVAKYGDDHYETATARASYGDALARSGDLARGTAELRRAVASLEAVQQPDVDQIATLCERLALVYLDRGDAASGVPLLERIDTLLAQLAQKDSYWDGRTDTLRARAALLQNQGQQAHASLMKAAAALAASVSPDPILLVEVPLLQAHVAGKLGDVAASLTYARLGAERLAALRHPPARLVRLAESLPTSTTRDG